jgi:general secretion pathway protein G
MSRRLGGRRGGFTLIEVLLVVAIIAILASIVVPRVWPTVRESRESELRANLRGLRNALGLFMAHCGDWPGRLEDLTASDPTGLVGGGGSPISPDCFQGPYLIATSDGQLPCDPFTGARDWDYDPSSGAVHSASAEASGDGTPYSSW